ncbi:hypothetical protein DNJ95_06455 [Stutzerimonas kirkiae]|uniref:Uncharacterized protein n=1 Tax=Stutzerimonas kirkiae TaxID=2211392 RepID=A0A4Q9RF05_9GAMM|nr:hypothetical protein [Stutzerimonas kirkiae]TBU98891.1 hypothetical protein DNJ96_04045 [Stutzerimonas kirkiae]TBV03985.1 hypothetical protein DNJ95_06455 [Stutzerimonas kirkiae]
MIRAIRNFLAVLLPQNGHCDRNLKLKNYRHDKTWEITYETLRAIYVDDELDYQSGILVDGKLILTPTKFEYHHPDDWDPASLDLNPATGMLMLDDCVDVMGNPYGFDNTSDFCCLDMDL